MHENGKTIKIIPAMTFVKLHPKEIVKWSVNVFFHFIVTQIRFAIPPNL